MSSSSARGQVEPLAALAAVFALGIGLSLYVGVLDVTLPTLSTDREMAPTAVDRFETEATSSGAVEPPLDGAASTARPTGYELNGTLDADDARWTVGPPRTAAADCERRRVGVRVSAGQIRPARLEVCVWPAP